MVGGRGYGEVTMVGILGCVSMWGGLCGCVRWEKFDDLICSTWISSWWGLPMTRWWCVLGSEKHNMVIKKMVRSGQGKGQGLLRQASWDGQAKKRNYLFLVILSGSLKLSPFYLRKSIQKGQDNYLPVYLPLYTHLLRHLNEKGYCGEKMTLGMRHC